MPLVSARVVSLITPDAIAAAAFAGPDQSVLCASIVQLTGEIIGDDVANHTFEWEQTFGTPVTLINPNTLTPSFVNPQTTDIEFTFYVDRNTPYESSDTVLITRRPTSTATNIAIQGGVSRQQQPRQSQGGEKAAFSFVAGSGNEDVDIDLRAASYSYNYPPDATYSPIYKAEDLARISRNLNGNYWLMNDIDLTDFRWEPLGSPQRPFSGELQGNGFSIENMSILEDPKRDIIASAPVDTSEFDLMYRGSDQQGSTAWTDIPTPANLEADLRFETDGSGAVDVVQITQGGKGYSNSGVANYVGTFNITSASGGGTPSVEATIEYEVVGGTIQSLTVLNGGAGYTINLISTPIAASDVPDPSASTTYIEIDQSVLDNGDEYLIYFNCHATNRNNSTSTGGVRVAQNGTVYGASQMDYRAQSGVSSTDEQGVSYHFMDVITANTSGFSYRLQNLLTDGFVNRARAFALNLSKFTNYKKTQASPVQTISTNDTYVTVTGAGVTLGAGDWVVFAWTKVRWTQGAYSTVALDDGTNTWEIGVPADDDKTTAAMIYLQNYAGGTVNFKAKTPNTNNDIVIDNTLMVAIPTADIKDFYGATGDIAMVTVPSAASQTNPVPLVTLNIPSVPTTASWMIIGSAAISVNNNGSVPTPATSITADVNANGAIIVGGYNGLGYQQRTVFEDSDREGYLHFSEPQSWTVGDSVDIAMQITTNNTSDTNVTGSQSLVAFPLESAVQYEKIDIGLFSRIGNGAVIENVGVTNALIGDNVSEDVYSAILAGSAQGPSTDDGGAVTIRNCYVQGSVAPALTSAGGLIGHTGTNVSSIYENTYSDVTVPGGGAFVGGWAGNFQSDNPLGPGEDASFSSVTLLLDFNGNDGATSVTDESNSSHSISFVNPGSVELDTSYKTFADSSLFLDGTNGFLTVPNSTDFDFGSNVFTVECFVRFRNTPGPTTDYSFISLWDADGVPDRAWRFGLESHTLTFVNTTNGIGASIQIQAAWTPSGNTWYHVAAVRDTGGVYRVYVDGTQIGTQTDAVAIFDAVTDLRIGVLSSGSGLARYMDGWIDGVRITKGVCRYPSGTSFTPPAEPTRVIVNNYWNSDKTTDGFGTDGDAALTSEVGGRTTAQLQVQGNYTNWDFVNIWEIGNTPQPSWANVVYLADFDGTAGATSYTTVDSVGRSLANIGSSLVDDQVKFGTTATYFDGNNDSWTSNDNGGISDTMVGDDWCCEGWMYHETGTFARGGHLLCGAWASLANLRQFNIAVVPSGEIQYEWSTDGTVGNVTQVTSTGANVGSIGVWHHIAVSYDNANTTLRMFANGKKVYENTSSNGVEVDSSGNSGADFVVGRIIAFPQNDYPHKGWLDDVRVTVGETLYTEDFQPPQQAHPIGTPTGLNLATLQNDVTQTVKSGFATQLDVATDEHAITWKRPVDKTSSQEEYLKFKGVIVEEQDPTTLGWTNPRYFPTEHSSAIMTQERRHRAFTVWDKGVVHIGGDYSQGNQPPKEVTYLVPNTVVPKIGAPGSPSAGGTSGTGYLINWATLGQQNSISLTITNPRKIAKTEEFLSTGHHEGGSLQVSADTTTVSKYTGLLCSEQDTTAMISSAGGVAGVDVNLSITRSSGANIGQ